MASEAVPALRQSCIRSTVQGKSWRGGGNEAEPHLLVNESSLSPSTRGIKFLNYINKARAIDCWLSEEKWSVRRVVGIDTENVQFRRILNVLNCSMWFFLVPHMRTLCLFIFPWRWNVTSSTCCCISVQNCRRWDFLSWVRTCSYHSLYGFIRRRWRRIRRRLCCGTPSFRLAVSGFKRAALGSRPHMIHSLYRRTWPSWEFAMHRHPPRWNFSYHCLIIFLTSRVCAYSSMQKAFSAPLP
jgi:hypothetical protein